MNHQIKQGKQDMKCELITLEQNTAMAVLTNTDQVAKLVQAVREKIESFEGKMETGVGRKAIISNANKARRTNSALAKVIDDLIAQEKSSIEKVELTIKMLRESKKALASGLTSVYNDARQSVTDYEAELAAQALATELAAIKVEIDTAHELALYINEQFDKDLAVQLEQQRKDEEAQRAIIAQQQKERDDRIAKEAAEKATRDAELKAKQVAEQAEKDRLAAIEAVKQAEREKIAAEERAKIQVEQAANNARISAEQAEIKRLADIESAKQAEIKRQQDEESARLAEQARLEANKAHSKKIHSEMKQAFIVAGLSTGEAELAVIALVKKQVPHIGSVQY